MIQLDIHQTVIAFVADRDECCLAWNSMNRAANRMNNFVMCLEAVEL
jgi:hypothetical protein